MGFSKIKEIEKLSDQEIRNEILNAKKALFELRLQQATRQAFKSHLFKHTKHRINQLLMVQSQRIALDQFQE
jgi:large subunit ribosomal protein L29